MKASSYQLRTCTGLHHLVCPPPKTHECNLKNTYKEDCVVSMPFLLQMPKKSIKSISDKFVLVWNLCHLFEEVSDGQRCWSKACQTAWFISTGGSLQGSPSHDAWVPPFWPWAFSLCTQIEKKNQENATITLGLIPYTLLQLTGCFFRST